MAQPRSSPVYSSDDVFHADVLDVDVAQLLDEVVGDVLQDVQARLGICGDPDGVVLHFFGLKASPRPERFDHSVRVGRIQLQDEIFLAQKVPFEIAERVRINFFSYTFIN